MKSTLYLLAHLSAIAWAGFGQVAAASDAVALKLHPSLLDGAFSFEGESQATPIDRYLNGVYTTGMAVTSINVSHGIIYASNVLGIALAVDSYTDTQTFSQTRLRPTILVDFNAAIDTWGRTEKEIYFNEAGFSTTAARSSATSSITFYDLDTSASGLGWRIRERIAERRAQEELMAQKSWQEAAASAEIAAQLNFQLDDRTNAVLAPLNATYFDKVLPLIQGSGLSGRLRFASDPSAFSITTESEATSASPVDPQTPVALVVGDEVVGQLLSQLAAGRTLNGGDLIDDEAAASDVKFRLAGSNGVSVLFTSGGIEFTVEFAEIRRGNAAVKNMTAKLTATLDTEGGEILLDLDHEVVVSAADGRVLAEAQKQLARELVRSLVPAVTVDVRGKSFSFAATSLALASLSLDDGILSASFNRVWLSPQIR